MDVWEIDIESDEWNEAYEYACQRAREEGDIDPDDPDDEELIFAWADDYYYDLMRKKGK